MTPKTLVGLHFFQEISLGESTFSPLPPRVNGILQMISTFLTLKSHQSHIKIYSTGIQLILNFGRGKIDILVINSCTPVKQTRSEMSKNNKWVPPPHEYVSRGRDEKKNWINPVSLKYSCV